MHRLTAWTAANGVDQWGVCAFDALPALLPVRSRERIPANAASVIVLLFGYYTNEYTERNVARYAIADDYHQIVGGMLNELVEKLQKSYKTNTFIPFVDASPIPEVTAASLAGLGGVGRNGLLQNPVYGSRCFIGEIVTDLPLAASVPSIGNACAGCGRCIAVCPSGALNVNGLEKARCRSEITQKKGALSEWEMAQIRAGGYVWGCDCCTDCCPCNAHAAKSSIEAFWRDNQPQLGEDNLDTLCKEKAYGWRGASVLRRNLRLINEYK